MLGWPLLPCLYSVGKLLPSSLASLDSRVAHLNARNAIVPWRNERINSSLACKILNIRWTKIKNNLVRMENYEMFDDRAFFLFFNLNKL